MGPILGGIKLDAKMLMVILKVFPEILVHCLGWCYIMAPVIELRVWKCCSKRMYTISLLRFCEKDPYAVMAFDSSW